MKGLFVTFEGPEGSGKSTQAGRLEARLRSLGYEVLRTREPGGTPTGELIREILQHDKTGEPIAPSAEALLFAASRAQLVRNVIAPALDRGACVVCDRFADSTTAYQGYGRGFDVETMIQINAFAIGETIPGITFLLDLDVSLGFERLGKRNQQRATEHDRFEREEQSFHERVRAGYLDLARRWPGRFTVLDGSADEDETAARVWQAVQERLSQRGDAQGILNSGS
jgi:dTMP kinase